MFNINKKKMVSEVQLGSISVINNKTKSKSNYDKTLICFVLSYLLFSQYSSIKIIKLLQLSGIEI